MKVLVVTSAKSGPLKNAHSISRYLAAAGDKVHLYLLDSPEYQLDFHDVTVDRPHRLLDPLGYCGRVVRLGMLGTIVFHPDVILTSFALSVPVIRLFFKNVPIAYRMMGIPQTQYSQGALKFVYAIETQLAKKYARELVTVTTAEHCQRTILRKWETRVHCVHTGVDTRFYRPPEDKMRLRNELGLGQYDHVVTLGLTRFNEIFRPLTYIRWYLDAICQHRERKMLSLILGKARVYQRRQIKRLFEEYLADEKAYKHSFKVGYVGDAVGLRKYYQASDFLVSFMPQSRMEKEALACGIPVVTEFWEGETARRQLGLLQHDFVKDRFIRIVNILLTDKDLRRRLSSVTRVVAENDFSLEVMGRRYRRILEMVILKSKCRRASSNECARPPLVHLHTIDSQCHPSSRKAKAT